MGFFDNIGKKATAAYEATAEKTGQIAKEAKLRMKINENKSDINDLYKEIGKKVYEKHVRQESIDIRTELEEECTKIDLLSAEIETSLKSILELKDKKQCPKCHSEIELKAKFCSNCGEKQPEEEVTDAELIIEELEDSEIKPENEEEKEIVEKKVSGEDTTERVSAIEGDFLQEESANVNEDKKEENQ